MSAVMPPKHDLRGGKASADSFAMSSSIFIPLTSRSFFAGENRELGRRQQAGLVHGPGPISGPPVVERNLFISPDIFWDRALDAETGCLEVRRYLEEGGAYHHE